MGVGNGALVSVGICTLLPYFHSPYPSVPNPIAPYLSAPYPSALYPSAPYPSVPWCLARACAIVSGPQSRFGYRLQVLMAYEYSGLTRMTTVLRVVRRAI